MRLRVPWMDDMHVLKDASTLRVAYNIAVDMQTCGYGPLSKKIDLTRNDSNETKQLSVSTMHEISPIDYSTGIGLRVTRVDPTEK